MPGSVVGISIFDEVERFLTTLALLALGTRQVTLATFDTRDVREDLIQRAGPSWVVDDAER